MIWIERRALAVGLHGRDRVVRRFDGDHRVVAAPSADGLRVAVATGDGGVAGANQGVGGVFGSDQFGEERLAHGPPFQARVERGLDLFEVLADGESVVPVRESLIESPQALEPRLESRLGPAGAAVPRLEIIEHGADLHQRVDLGVGQIDLARDLGVPGQQCREIEPEDIVALIRPPQSRIGQKLGPEIAHRIAEGPPDPRRIVVLLDVAGEAHRCPRRPRLRAATRVRQTRGWIPRRSDRHPISLDRARPWSPPAHAGGSPMSRRGHRSPTSGRSRDRGRPATPRPRATASP